MSEGVHPDTVHIADLIVSMPTDSAARTLAGMDYYVRERVLRVIEHDQHNPTKVRTLRDLLRS